MSQGTLYLLPADLGVASPQLFSGTYLNTVLGLRHFIVENLRSARRFLRAIGYKEDFDSVHLFEMGKHDDPQSWGVYLDACREGSDMGLLSEAGAPCIADPGSTVVGMAHAEGIRVVPMAGPSSILMALMASGFNGQLFEFRGYLPIEKADRRKAIQEMERVATARNRTQIFMETPYRNKQLLQDLVAICRPQTELCIAAEISLPQERISTKCISDWKQGQPDLHKKPAIFLLGLTGGPATR